MAGKNVIRESKEPCESCGKPVAGFESVSLGSMEKGHRLLCMACYNATMSEHCGVAFEHPDFEPVRLTDVDGEQHEFHFTTRLLGDRVAIDARELKDGEPTNGYEFSVLGFDPEGEILGLFGKLMEKMRRALSRKHLERREPGLGIADHRMVRARIDCDLDNEDDYGNQRPLVVIDGKPITWDAFGHMLMSFEGWQFRMELLDPSDEA